MALFLTKPRSGFLVLVTIWISLAGAAVGFIVPLICATRALAGSKVDSTNALRITLEMSASHITLFLAAICTGLTFLSAAVWAQVWLNASEHSDDGIVALEAKSIFVLSLLLMMGTISAAVCSVVLYHFD